MARIAKPDPQWPRGSGVEFAGWAKVSAKRHCVAVVSCQTLGDPKARPMGQNPGKRSAETTNGWVWDCDSRAPMWPAVPNRILLRQRFVLRARAITGQGCSTKGWKSPMVCGARSQTGKEACVPPYTWPALLPSTGSRRWARRAPLPDAKPNQEGFNGDPKSRASRLG